MRAVNLLPRDEVPKSFANNRGIAFAAAGGTALVTAALCTLMLGAGGAVKDHRANLESLNAELVALPAASAATASEDATLTAEKTARTGALSSALAERVAWDGVLRQISQVLPEDVWLASLQTTAATAPAGAEPEPAGVTLVGTTYSQSGVARFLSRLSVVPTLTKVTLESSLTSDTGSQKLVRFTIRAEVKTA
jgi:Tfp pilus assembly protein PilN